MVQSHWSVSRCTKVIVLAALFQATFRDSSHGDVGEGSRGENELVQSSEERSHEGVRFGEINLSSVVDIELSPGSWEELSHVSFHFSFRDLLGDKENFSSGFLASIFVEDLGSSWLTSSVGGLNGVMVEDVVHDIILIGTVVSRSWSISSSWSWTFLVDSDGLGVLDEEEGC